MVLYGQIVVGPPGAGKTTYCQGMEQFMKSLGRRVDIVNLDFANDCLSYTPSIDVRDLITLESVMEEHTLGPNGGLVFCMESLLVNIKWLIDKLEQLESNYIIFDCPGQVELYSHHSCVQDIVHKLEKQLDCRLCCVNLIDSFYCSQPATFISAVLLVTSIMLRLGLPHVNVLSKIDLLSLYGPLPFSLDFFTEMLNLMPLCRYIENPVGRVSPLGKKTEENNDEDEEETECDPEQTTKSSNSSSAGEGSNLTKLQQKFKKMSESLCEVMDDYGLVSFQAMYIQDAETVGRVLAAIDKANGFSMASYTASEIAKRKSGPDGDSYDYSKNLNDVLKIAAKNLESVYSVSLDIQEKYYNVTPGSSVDNSDTLGDSQVASKVPKG